MSKQRIKNALRTGILAGAAATLILSMGPAPAAAQAPVQERLEAQRERREQRRDRIENRRDRREDRRDRIQDRRDRRQDRRDQRLDRRDRWDRKKDRWEHRRDRWDKRHKRWIKNKRQGHWKHGAACGCAGCGSHGAWGWIKHAPRVVFRDSDFYFHGDLDVYFGGLGLHLRLGNLAPDGYVYVHAQTGKRFRSVRTFQRWCRANPRYEPFLVVAPAW